MTEETERLVDRTDEPVTADRLVDDLRALGVEAGDTLLVHSSLSALGWVPGGPQTAVDALQRAVTADGTAVVPTHSTHLCNPADWSNPPIPEAWLDTVRESMPAFDPDLTPTRGMGAIPECFRTHPEAVRSDHPGVSFAAWGADADRIVTDHSLAYELGDGSPLADVYDLGGDVLMLGTGHDTNTSLHLAEYRADYPKEERTNRAPVRRDGERRWVQFPDIERHTGDFTDVGAAFEREVGIRERPVGEATGRLVDQPALVDFAVEWFEANRG